eukprot:TRINITY_DN332_c0_g2_i1.p1 TRINITY_DN332_c0_g2~~TRINITY_DN332_c0_g2_i1.p1  ORF type:complete len:443 (-),score=97.40 TRINITY_DN332_c0_g2_i1:19-1347(-)
MAKLLENGEGEKEKRKRKVFLQSSENDLLELDEDALQCCSTVRNMLRGRTTFLNSLGGQFSFDGNYVLLKKEGRILASLLRDTDDEFVVALPDVKTATLQRVVDYCKCHNSKSASDYVKGLKQSVLCELASASYYLDIKPLVNLTSRAIATQISGKTSEEIRETFCNINYEQYAPVFASSLATRCRLQRKITAGKKKDGDEPRLADARPDDERSVEDLLSFIDGGSGSARTPLASVSASAAVGPASARKKTKKKKPTPPKRGSDSPVLHSPLLSRAASDAPPPSGVGSSSPALVVTKPAAVSPSSSAGSRSELSRSVSLPDAALASRAADLRPELPQTRAALSSSMDVFPTDTSAMASRRLAPRLSVSLDGAPSDDDDDDDDFVFERTDADEAELDPEMEAVIQREVEEFRLRLELINSTSAAGRIPLPKNAHAKHSVVGVH